MPTVRTEVVGSTLVVRIDRERKRNAIDAETATGLDEALNRLEDDPTLRVGIVTGTRTVFSAGTDLRDGSGEPTDRGGEYGVVRRVRSTPLIAAVEGVAFGGGLEIALACDLVVAARTARFALPEVLRGVVASSGALFRAMRALPLNVATELLLTGGELDAERAERLGLVNRLTEPGAALDTALALADRIGRASPVAVRATMAAGSAQLQDTDRRGWEATAQAVEAVRAGADLPEGIAAFFERRAPVWPGP